MDRTVEKNCWGVTAWALTGFALIVFALVLFNGGGAEMASATVPPVS